MNTIRDCPQKDNLPDIDTKKPFWMRLADRIYGIPPGEFLRLVSDSSVMTIRAAGDCFVRVHIENPNTPPSHGEATDLRTSKNARLIASWGFNFAPGEEERTRRFTQPPKGEDDVPSIIPITRQLRRREERLARKRSDGR